MREVVSKDVMMTMIIDYGAVRIAAGYCFSLDQKAKMIEHDQKAKMLLEKITVQIERLYADRGEE
jgi:hypothetical protein